jgi:O-antigen/teichoic acid export membrane protein
MVAKKLLREAANLVSGYGLALLLGLVASIILTRALGEEARGVMAWLLTLQGLAVQAAALISYPAARQLAAATPPKQWPQLLGSFSAFSLFGLILAAPFLAYGLFFAPLGQTHLLLLVVLFAQIPFMIMAQVWMGIILTEPKWWVALLQGSGGKALMLLGVLALWALGTITLEAVIWWQVVSGTALLVVFYLLLQVPFTSWRIERARWSAAWPFIGASWAAIGLLFALPKLVILQLGNTGQLAAAGHYAVANGLFEAALAIPTLATSVLITHFTRHRAHQDGGGQGARRKVSLAVAGFMGVVAGSAALVAPWLIPFLFGAPFVASVVPFQILMVCLVLAAVHQAWLSRLMASTAKYALIVPPLLGCLVVAMGCVWWGAALNAVIAAWLTLAGYAVMAGSTYLLKGQH